jgi:CheY-like chemotaxis protein
LGAIVHVLVIDDDDDVRKMVSRFFEGRGHTVLALGGALGLPSRVSQWWRGGKPPDAIVLDINMPKMSGDDALKLLARNPTSREVPVVLYSALEAADGEEHLVGHPRCAFVSKSERLTVLLEKIEELRASQGARRP